MTDWNAIVDEIGPKLYAYFCSRFNAILANDLTQETLIRLVDKHQDGSFNINKGSLKMYAFGIARFVRLEALKSESKHRHSEFYEDHHRSDDSLEQNFEDKSELQNLRIAISQLPEPQQEIILLQIEDELSLKEIGNILSMPSSTVKSHVHRAKANLIKMMN